MTRDTGPGLHVADLPAGTRLDFTFFWPNADRWEGRDFAIAIVAPVAASGAREE